MDFAASSFDYVNQNTIHPVGLAALAIVCALLLFGPMRTIPLVLIGLAVYIPTAQRIVLAGADFAFLRIGVMVAGAACDVFTVVSLSNGTNRLAGHRRNDGETHTYAREHW